MRYPRNASPFPTTSKFISLTPVCVQCPIPQIDAPTPSTPAPRRYVFVILPSVMRIFFPTIIAPFVFFDACWFLKPFTCMILRSRLIKLPKVEETTNAAISFLITQVEILPSEKEREEGVFWAIK